MNFGQAIEAAKKGYKVAREGWNGKGMFAFVSEFSGECFVSRPGSTNVENYKLRTSWFLKTAQGDVATWSPSGSDSLAEDWMIVE